MRVVTMVTPQNIDQIENIAGWVKEAGIETYGISAITPMGRADLEDKNNLLLKTEYSRAMKSHFRKFGNQMSGSGNHLCNYASLLA